MLRKSGVISALLLWVAASQVHALELGSAVVESALNQPLRVRIEILELEDTRLQDISVQMASMEDFQGLDAERAGFLDSIRLDVEATATGNFVILTSAEVVRESYLRFILDTRWPNGRLLSDHTILLDPPVFDEQQTARDGAGQAVSPPDAAPSDRPVVDQTAPVTPGVSSANQSAAAIPEPELTDDISSAAAPEVAAEPQTIETVAADTLSSIALRLRPDPSVSIQQTMLAIQALNPDAFIDGNINRLRSGQVLRVPTLDAIEAVDPGTAVNEVARQNRQSADQQPLTTPPGATPEPDQQPRGQLSIVSGDAVDSASGAGSTADAQNAELDRRIAELENQLALRREEADRARIEREELESRLADLEIQIDEAQELIRLRDMQLAQLQQSLAEAAAQAQVQAQAAAQAATGTPQPAPAANRPGGFSDTLMRMLSDNAVLALAGVLLLILLLVVILLRRNRIDEGGEDFEEIVEDFEEEQGSGSGAPSEADAFDREPESIAGLDGEDGDFESSQQAANAVETSTEELDPDFGESGDPDDMTMIFDLAGDEAEATAGLAESATGKEELPDDPVEGAAPIAQSDEGGPDFAFDEEDRPAAAPEEEYDSGSIDFEPETETLAEGDDVLTFDSDKDRLDEIDQLDELDELDEVDEVDGIDQLDEIEEIDQLDEIEEIDQLDEIKAGVPEEEEITQAVDEKPESFDSDPEGVADTVAGKWDSEAEPADLGIDFDPDLDLDQNMELESLDESTALETGANAGEDNLDDLVFLSEDEAAELESGSDMEEAGLFSDDEAATKLELAYAYQKMGDLDGAREILGEVLKEGNATQVKEAEGLLASLKADAAD
jgi:pilus assembly protein FimV